MTRAAEFDIRVSADEVTALLQAGRTAEALRLLAAYREGRSEVVQDALDRFVVADAGALLAQARRDGTVPAEDPTPLDTRAIDRVLAATGVPRFPVDAPEEDARYADGLAGLSDAQKHDVYASIVRVRGNATAHAALERGEERVILGLRREDSTLISMDDDRTPTRNESTERLGRGAYDDRIVVLWTAADGTRRVHEVPQANTEPTAQYDHHAGSDGRRRLSGGGVDTTRRAALPGYEDVSRRKIEGSDVDGDGLRDLGRLAEGTYEMQPAWHPSRPGEPPHHAFRPTPEAVAASPAGVQRDSNGDGWFTTADVEGVQALNDSFKIHRGAPFNTDSAGCQTIHQGDYDAFLTAARGNPAQTRWHYVLTSASPGMFRDVNRVEDLPVAPQRDPRPGAPAEAPPPVLQPLPLDPRGQRLLRDANARVDGLDASLSRASDPSSERMAAALAVAAHGAGLDRIDHVVLSVHSGRVAAGEHVFAVQGALGDPAHLRTHVRTDVAVQTPVEQSLQRLADLDQQWAQSQQHELQQQQLAQREQQEAPRRTMA